VKSLTARQAIWAREVALARRSKTWRVFARELRACAEFLDGQYQAAVSGTPRRTPASVGAFFAPKFVRLLMGLSLENLAKGLLLSGPNADRFMTRNRLSFEKKGHDLRWLLSQAGFALDEPTGVYVDAWSLSAEWFGKYPFPVEMNRVLDEYAPLASSKALTRRVRRGQRQVTVRDILHGGIGHGEWQEFTNLFLVLEKAAGGLTRG
jgi:hypothetical protein